MPLRTAPSTLKQAGRSEFDLDEFKRSITQHGYTAVWTKAALCPNRDPAQEDHHRISCELCDHHGFIYYEPTDIKVHITSLGLKQLFLPESRYQPGMAYFTTLPEHKLNFWDKVQLTTAKGRFSQVLKLSSTRKYKLKYPALALQYAVLDNGTTLPVMSIGIDDAGAITIPTGVPSTGFLSVSFFYKPVYLLIDLVHQIRDSRLTEWTEDKEAEFPNQAVGQLDFLVRDEGLA
jgi:hypothetical protein